MTSLWPYLLLAIVAGFCLPSQAGINANLNLWSRSPVIAAAISFAVGTLCLVIYALVLRIPLASADSISRHPWWIWSGGILGAFYVASTVILAPKLGATSMVATIIGGQMAASLFLDHFGFLGYPEHPVGWLRLTGVFLLIAGVVMIRRF